MTLIQLFTAIANAIRNKKGTQATIAAEDFPTEIGSISTGTDTSDANATASDILSTKTAYVNGVKLTGTIPNNGTLNYTPTTSNQSIPSGYTSGGTVSGVTSSIDSNIQAENIKKDITILGVTGTYEGSGGGGTGEKDVNFYDYDGTLTNSYTKTEFLALESLPANPSHTGLVAQGWNWTLADAKTYVTDYDKLNIGQMYTTASGLSEFDIELTTPTGLTVTLNMDGTKNWGDGTSDTNTTHTYLNAGEYTIKCNGTTMTTSSTSGLFGQSNSSRNYYIINIRLANVTNISDYAFQYCYSLVNITIPSSVTTIDDNAFNYCVPLTSITIPSSITTIGGSAFQNCFSLVNIIIPSSVTTIGGSAFQYCYSLRSITIPNSVTTIGGSAFYYCYSLVNITIPSSVTTIGDSTFYYCYSLSSITIPNSVTTIGGSAFQNCYSLRSITIPNSVTTIGASAFQNCYSLRSITIPNGVVTINNTTLNSCLSVILYDFSNANRVPTLSNVNAFSGINYIAKIVVPDSLYENWKVAYRWSTYANYIYKASEV